VLDGVATLPRLLDSLFGQSLDGGFEVIVVDSGSTDGSRQAARGTPCRLFAARSFGHGRTRNEALALARAPLAVLLTQDAIPHGSDFLRALVEPLERDPGLAGTYARQLAPPGIDPLLAAAIARWCPADPDRRQPALDAGEFDRLSPGERVERCRFDNVASCVRIAVWRTIPFPDVPFGEDAVWAKRVLLAGHDLFYCCRARVVHGHGGGLRTAYRRDRAAHAMLAAEFGLRTVPGPLHGVLAWLAGWGSDLGDLRARSVTTREVPAHLARGALRRIGALTGQYVGGRAGTHHPDGGLRARYRGSGTGCA